MNWFIRQLATEIIYEIEKRKPLRKIEIFLPNIAEPIFYEVFLKHNGRQWFPAEGGKITFYDEPTRVTSINRKDAEHSFLPAGFMCDVLHYGYSFDQKINGEILSPITWNVTYQKGTGNLTVTAHIRWIAIGTPHFVGLRNWHINDAKYGYRASPPEKDKVESDQGKNAENDCPFRPGGRCAHQ